MVKIRPPDECEQKNLLLNITQRFTKIIQFLHDANTLSYYNCINQTPHKITVCAAHTMESKCFSRVEHKCKGSLHLRAYRRTAESA